MDSEPSHARSECVVCGSDILDGEDFCRECGHSTQFAVDSDRAGELDLDKNRGDICPNCGATHMVILPQGYPQCETCGYTDRH